MVYLETTVAKYLVGYRLHEPNPQRNPNYLEFRISSSARSYLITGLDEYTLYDLIINAIDGNGFNRAPYRETRRTSAERKKDYTCHAHSKKSETVENSMQHYLGLRQ